MWYNIYGVKKRDRAAKNVRGTNFMPLVVPQEVIIKKYALSEAGKHIGRYGKNCLIIAGGHFYASEDWDFLKATLSLRGIAFDAEEYIGGEPVVDYVDGLAAEYKSKRGAPLVDCVIGIGGGSVLDAAKAVSGMLTNGGGVESYIDAKGKTVMTNAPLPFIAVPTTAGTGAEATKNAVLKHVGKKYKRSFRDERLMAKCVIIDASLYAGTPKEVTAYSGMDSLAQLIEAFTSKRATKETEEFCRQGLRHIQYLAAAYSEGDNILAREETALAAYKSGVAISNGGVGAVHALASPIGAHTGLPHGLICGILLPHVMEVNKEHALPKYAEIGRILTGDNGDDRHMADSAVAAVRSLAETLKIPATFRNERLVGLAPQIVGECIDGGSMRSNPHDFDAGFWAKFMTGVCI
ncbi:MAG: iron-containing alcohol dehydrogenase [Clostridiales bacterium]|jgi:alcohol dehydrogenase|nr:iron-containing alcohol dehydrogenase [Clostridiales bacterium]